jgi:Leucine-rich repeat (LRR) protein
VPIAGLSNLRELAVHSMQDLTRFPADIWQLPELRRVRIEGCKDLGSLPDNIPADAKLESFHITSSESFRHLPSSLCALSNMTNLYVGYTAVEALPDQFTLLTRLRRLEFDYAPISRLPPSMDGLESLEVVRFRDLDAEIGGAFAKPMPSMRHLSMERVANVQNIDFNGLTGLTRLELSLTADQSQLPPSIGRLSSLRELTIEDCGGLTTLPAEIGQLTNLRVLRLFDHQGDFTLPEAVSSLASLSVMHIGGEGTLRVPQTIPWPATLTMLEMDGDEIQLPPTLTNLSRLHQLTIECSAATLDTLPALRNMPSLRRLTADLLAIEADARVREMLTHASLTYLRVRVQGELSMAPVIEALSTLTRLRELNVTIRSRPQTPHRTAQPAAASPPINLTTLTYLSFTSHDSTVSPWVFQLVSLQRLDYKHLQEGSLIHRLSPDVSKLVNLRSLEIYWSQIWLCAAVTALSKLTRLHCGDGQGDTEHRQAVDMLLQRGVHCAES